jgi:hypothetical protein
VEALEAEIERLKESECNPKKQWPLAATLPGLAGSDGEQTDNAPATAAQSSELGTLPKKLDSDGVLQAGGRLLTFLAEPKKKKTKKGAQPEQVQLTAAGWLLDLMSGFAAAAGRVAREGCG